MINETLIYISVLTVFILSILDHFKIGNDELKNKLGWVVIYSNLLIIIILIINFLLFIVSLLILAKESHNYLFQRFSHNANEILKPLKSKLKINSINK